MADKDHAARDGHGGLRLRDLVAVAIINVVWGLNIVAVKKSVTLPPPFTAGSLRLMVVLLICISGLRIVPARMPLPPTLGLLNGSVYLVIIGIGLSFGGVVLLVFDPAVAGEVPGLLLTLLGTLILATGSPLQRRLSEVPVLTLYAWIGLMGCATMTILSLVFEPGAIGSLPDLRVGQFGWILFSALGSTIVGQGGMAWLLQRHVLSTVMPLTLGTPVISVLASSWIFGTVLTPLMIAGGIIALSGVVITLRSAQASKVKA